MKSEEKNEQKQDSSSKNSSNQENKAPTPPAPKREEQEKKKKELAFNCNVFFDGKEYPKGEIWKGGKIPESLKDFID